MEYDIERYLNVRSASGGALGPEGETLAFLLDTTGTRQVWTMTAADGWATQRTFYDEPVSFLDWSPERRELVFGMDEGGNERMQLYRLDPAVGEIVGLTARPEAKHRWGGWSPDGDRFAFAANRRDESVFDVYVQSREETGDDATLVHEGDGWLSVAGWSPDGDRLLVHEAHSSFDHDLYALDLAGDGGLHHLTPHDGDARFQSPEWGPDGESVYVATDRDSDTLGLERVALDAAGAGDADDATRTDEGDNFETVVDGGEWNVDGVSLDADTGRLVYSRNVDGYTELTVGRLDGATGLADVAEVDTAAGVAGGVSWGPDGERFAFTATGRTDNANVHVGRLDGETTRWTNAGTAGIPRETFVEPELVHYPTFDGREIPAFFSLPTADTGDGDTPVVVDIHGGPESQRRPSFAPTTQYFLNNGYAVFEPNVRGSSGYGKAYTHLDDVEKRMDSVKDVRAGVEWLYDHPAVDSDRIAVKGGSYGGFMVLACMTEYPELWAAGVDVVGIANFVTFLENTGEWRRSLREAEYGSLAEDRDFLQSVSPINRVDRIDAPLFVLHGENDPRVPVGEAEQIVAELDERGVPVRKLIFEDEGHGFSKLDNRIEAAAQTVEFLDEHV
ncbi:MAG: prolyl oligopeptidase family serine peptidase [Halolamina sp.]